MASQNTQDAWDWADVWPLILTTIDSAVIPWIDCDGIIDWGGLKLQVPCKTCQRCMQIKGAHTFYFDPQTTTFSIRLTSLISLLYKYDLQNALSAFALCVDQRSESMHAHSHATFWGQSWTVKWFSICCSHFKFADYGAVFFNSWLSCHIDQSVVYLQPNACW